VWAAVTAGVTVFLIWLSRGAAALRELLGAEHGRVVTSDRSVELTNKEAERAPRGPVPWRKGSYGTDSAAGSRFVESVLTAVASCQQQGRDVLAFVMACCEALRHNTACPSLIPQS
jgi:transposase